METIFFCFIYIYICYEIKKNEKVLKLTMKGSSLTKDSEKNIILLFYTIKCVLIAAGFMYKGNTKTEIKSPKY